MSGTDNTAHNPTLWPCELLHRPGLGSGLRHGPGQAQFLKE